MTLKLILAATACTAVAACSQSPAPGAEEPVADATPVQAATMHNLLLEDWDTPFGVPPFDRIGSGDYLPAVRAAM